VRSEDTAFAELGDTAPDPAMVEKAGEIIARLDGSFDPRRDFRERFQEALFQLVQAKLRGDKPVFPPALPVRSTALPEALSASLAKQDGAASSPPERRPRA